MERRCLDRISFFYIVFIVFVFHHINPDDASHLISKIEAHSMASGHELWCVRHELQRRLEVFDAAFQL